jgi:hypothetical protein
MLVVFLKIINSFRSIFYTSLMYDSFNVGFGKDLVYILSVLGLRLLYM